MNVLPFFLAGFAVAGQPDASAAPGGEISSPTASGERLFRRGVDAYDQGQNDAALKWFQEAYRLAPEPSILFNIAQAYRAIGDCQKALDTLDAVITANGADRSLVNRARTKHDDFERCASTQSPPRAPSGVPASVARTVDAPPTMLVAPVSPARLARSSWLSSRWGKGCMVSAGTALGFGVAGVGLAWAAHDRANVVNEARIWSMDVQAADSERRSLATSATVTFMATGVAAILSGTMCWLGWRSRE